jgi:pimeloyl-ACP methyl ester carboxylesterase
MKGFRFLSSVLFLLLMTGASLAQSKPKEAFFTTSDGVKIHYYVMGKGTPVVLIHGYTGTAWGNWFANGIAPALAKNHLVVALDNRNHGKSDKPQLNGPGKAQDVVELMDHLKIQKAHLHGYSMGGAMTAQLLTMIPERILSAGFGGSGITESDPEWQAKVPKDKVGRDPDEDKVSLRLRIAHAMDNGMSKEEAEKLAATPPRTPAAATPTATTPAQATPAATTPTNGATSPAAARLRPALKIDLTQLNIPMLAINGEYDRPIAKTHRMWRELKNFTNVVLPGKSHLTAIASGFMPKEYLESVVKFIDANDPKK